MVVSRRRVASVLLFSLLNVLVLSAQDAESTKAFNGKVLLYVDQASGGGLSDDQLLVISRSLLLSIQASIGALSISDASGSVHSASADSLSEFSLSAGADFWLWAQVSVDAQKTRLHVRGFDLPPHATTLDTVIERAGSVAAADLPYEKWDDLVSLVKKSLPVREATIRDQSSPRQVTLSVRALPGTVVTGPGGKKATAGNDGFALLSLEAPGEITIRSIHAGYYPDNRRFFLEGDKQIILNQIPASLWAIDASLLQMGYPSFDVTRFIFPNSFYVKLGFTSYAVGLAFTNTQVVTSNPLTDLVLQTGIYLRQEDVLFRPYVNLGVFVRVTNAPGAPLAVDALSWGGLQLSLGTEIGSSPRGRFFFEYQPMLYATSIPGLFQAQFGSNELPVGWSFSDKSAFNFLSFRFGYRWML